MSEVTDQGINPPAPNLVKVERSPIWARAMVIIGLGLTAAWTCLLGYGLVKLVQLAF